MKKTLFFLFIIFTMQSCKDQSKEIEALKQDNERLKIELAQQNENKTKYVWTVIHCKTGTFSSGPSDPKGHFEFIENTLYWSEINEMPVFNDDMKFKLEDDLENKCRRRYGPALHSIQKRETFVFDSYQEASEFKYATINKK